MPGLEVRTGDVAAVGTQMSSAEHTSPTSTEVVAPAQDSVSVAVARTLSARSAVITSYSAAADTIAEARGSMVITSAGIYDRQEAASTSTLGGNGSAAFAPRASMPAAAAPKVPMADIPAPAIGAPPAGGQEIARLIHGGPGPSGLHNAATRMRQHASSLTAAGSRLHGNTTALRGSWDSAAGDEATSRVSELASWYDRHATATSAVAAAMDQQATNFARARQTIPEPKEFVDTNNRIRAARAANAMPGSFGRYSSVIATWETKLAELNRRAVQGYATYATGGTDASVAGEPAEPPPGAVQTLNFGPIPTTPPEVDEESKESEAARWWVEWRSLEHEVSLHNSEVAALNRRRPLAGSNAAAVAAFNAEVSGFNYQAETIYMKQMNLYNEGLLLNIPVEQPDEPIIIDGIDITGGSSPTTQLPSGSSPAPGSGPLPPMYPQVEPPNPWKYVPTDQWPPWKPGSTAPTWPPPR